MHLMSCIDGCDGWWLIGCVNVVAIDIEDVGHGQDKKDKGSGGMSAKSLGSNHDGRVIASKHVH